MVPLAKGKFVFFPIVILPLGIPLAPSVLSSCPVTMTLISAVGNSVISGGEFPVIFPVNFVSQ
jgi:hypothetical protein